MGALRPGSVLAGRFEIERLAREGGMGAVYRARDRAADGRPIALKLLRQQGPQEALRFVREAQLLERIPHPSVVEYVAHGVDEAGFLYLAMEWLEGEDLDARLSRAPLTIDESVGIARAVAQVLAVAHRQGIVHRDLKPGNVFLVERGPARVKVLDFGIARLLGATLGTGTGMILGTPAYMPPEQARAQRDVDPRADVYALGCVLFECVTGRPPFQGDRPLAVLARMLLEDAPRLRSLRPDAPAALDDLVDRMLAKKREDRPADGAAAFEALSALDAAGPELARAAVPRPSVLGTDEQHLVSLVLVGAKPEVATERTLLPGELEEQDRSLAEAGASFGIHVESLADGSAVIAFAGAGIATDQAARAVRCALLLAAGAEGRPIAVATGLAHTAGAVPIGEVIDRATVLLAAGGPGVRVDDVTAGLLGARFELRPEGEAHRVVGERDSGVPLRRLLGRPTPCVGRDRELGTLEALFHECVRESVAHAALVTAPPGAGKSRLCAELLGRLAAERPAPRVWLGRGDPMSAGASFGLLGQVLRQATGLRGGEPLAAERARLREAVAGQVPAADRARIASFLGELVGIPFHEDECPALAAARADTMLMGDQMRRAFEDFLEAETSAGPVVLVFEDLHWGDLPSVGAVDAALRHLRERPLLALGFARPEVDELMLDLWAERGVQRLALGPLGRRPCERLVRAALPELDDARVAALVARSDGNAFFLEELIRAEAAGQGGEAPRTVLAILQARLDALTVEARRVLRAASVFGQTFWPGGVERLVGARRRPAFPPTADHRSREAFPDAPPRAAIPATIERWGDDTGDRPALVPPPARGDASTHDTLVTGAPTGAAPAARDPSRVEQLLTDLAEAELVEPRDDGRLAGEPAWAFRHALVQEAAYATLTTADRTLGHLLAGEWLQGAGEQEALVLAEHLERGGDREGALGWFRAAAEQALEGNDFAGAIARAERGIASGAAGGVLGELRVVQAEAAYWQGDLRTCLARAAQAADAVERGSGTWFAAQRLVATSAGPLGERDDLEGVARRLAIAQPVPEARGALVRAAAVTAAYLLHAGLGEHAEVLLHRADSIIARSPDLSEAVSARLRFARGVQARLAGDAIAYLEACTAAAAAAERAGDVRYAAAQRQNVGFAFLELGDSARALEAIESSLGELVRLGLEPQQASALGNAAVACLRLGDPAGAAARARRAAALATRHGNRRHEGLARATLAEALRAQGEGPEALAEAHRAVEALRATPASLPYARALVAERLADAGAMAEAREEIAAALDEWRRATQAPVRAVLVRLVAARLSLRAGDEDEARAQVAAAVGDLEARADRIGDPRLRDGFLTAIPEHRDVLALADALGVARHR